MPPQQTTRESSSRSPSADKQKCIFSVTVTKCANGSATVKTDLSFLEALTMPPSTSKPGSKPKVDHKLAVDSLRTTVQEVAVGAWLLESKGIDIGDLTNVMQYLPRHMRQDRDAYNQQKERQSRGQADRSSSSTPARASKNKVLDAIRTEEAQRYGPTGRDQSAPPKSPYVSNCRSDGRLLSIKDSREEERLLGNEIIRKRRKSVSDADDEDLRKRLKTARETRIMLPQAKDKPAKKREMVVEVKRATPKPSSMASVASKHASKPSATSDLLRKIEQLTPSTSSKVAPKPFVRSDFLSRLEETMVATSSSVTGSAESQKPPRPKPRPSAPPSNSTRGELGHHAGYAIAASSTPKSQVDKPTVLRATPGRDPQRPTLETPTSKPMVTDVKPKPEVDSYDDSDSEEDELADFQEVVKKMTASKADAKNNKSSSTASSSKQPTTPKKKGKATLVDLCTPDSSPVRPETASRAPSVAPESSKAPHRGGKDAQQPKRKRGRPPLHKKSSNQPSASQSSSKSSQPGPSGSQDFFDSLPGLPKLSF